MSATIRVTCNVNNPNNIPARNGTRFGFTLFHFLGFSDVPLARVPELVSLGNIVPVPFSGSTAHAQAIVVDESIQYWVSNFVIEGLGGSDPSKGSWNDDFDVRLRQFVGPFKVFDDREIDRPNIINLTGELVPHQTLH